MDYYLYARAKLYEHLRCLMKEEGLVRKGADGEALHRMRVSSRRLRAALRVFQGVFPRKKSLKWNKRIRKIGRALGEGRELDILIGLFQGLKEKIENPVHISAIEEIIKFLQRGRKNAQERIVGVLEDLKTQKKLRDLQGFIKELSNKGHGSIDDDFTCRKKVMISKRLGRLLKYKPYVYHPQEIKKLHLMRISAKNLRYTLEIFRAFYGVKVEEAIRGSKAIQDVLGDLHEFDVCLDLLEELAAGHKKDKDFLESVAYLKSRIRSSRRQAYEKFVKIWERWEKEDVWGKLRRAI